MATLNPPNLYIGTTNIAMVGGRRTHIGFSWEPRGVVYSLNVVDYVNDSISRYMTTSDIPAAPTKTIEMYTYYCDHQDEESGDGSEDTPWKSFWYALTQLRLIAACYHANPPCCSVERQFLLLCSGTVTSGRDVSDNNLPQGYITVKDLNVNITDDTDIRLGPEHIVNGTIILSKSFGGNGVDVGYSEFNGCLYNTTLQLTGTASGSSQYSSPVVYALYAYNSEITLIDASLRAENCFDTNITADWNFDQVGSDNARSIGIGSYGAGFAGCMFNVTYAGAGNYDCTSSDVCHSINILEADNIVHCTVTCVGTITYWLFGIQRCVQAAVLYSTTINMTVNLTTSDVSYLRGRVVAATGRYTGGTVTDSTITVSTSFSGTPHAIYQCAFLHTDAATIYNTTLTGSAFYGSCTTCPLLNCDTALGWEFY